MKNLILSFFFSLLNFICFSQQKTYFLKIIEKNNAGWLQLSEYANNTYTNPIDPILVNNQLDYGYASLSGAAKYQELKMLNNNGENFIDCKMGLWRDPYHNNAPSRGGWNIKFQIVLIGDNEQAATPVYDASALDYYDDGKILFVIDTSKDITTILKTNTDRYDAFNKAHIRH